MNLRKATPLILFSVLLVLITSLPQLFLRFERGNNYNGAFAYFDTDELTYAAYVNALKDGRPRRNDPYTGNDGGKYETLYSIQFVPAYLIALSARFLHLSTASAFILVTPLVTLASFLLIYGLLVSLIGRPWLAATGSFTILCFGGFLALPPWETLGFPRYAFPFLRRYEPAVPFPLFFAMVFCVWRALTTKATSWAIGAGLFFVLLIYGYFFLWTAAAVWLLVLMVLWFWRGDKLTSLRVFGIIGLIGGLALIPYALMLAHRVPATDQSQLLELTHAPDLLRGPEVYALILIIWFARKSLTQKHLFALSFVVAPFLLFNQQIISGRSLQPFHYEEFIANYWVGLAACIALSSRSIQKSFAVPVTVAVVALGFLLSGVFSSGRLPYNAEVDRGLAAISQVNGRGVVFAPNRYVMTSVPIAKSNPTLWSHYTYTFSADDPKTQRVGLYKYLYYSGMSVDQFREMLKNDARLVEVFGARAHPYLIRQVSPISQSEVAEVAHEYSQLISEFSKRDASDPLLAWVILSPTDNPANVDKWYQRDQGLSVDGFTLFRLTLK